METDSMDTPDMAESEPQQNKYSEFPPVLNPDNVGATQTTGRKLDGDKVKFPKHMLTEIDSNVDKLGSGWRMSAWPLIDVGYVLRVPHSNEEQLIKSSGAARVVNTKGHQISNITERELERYDILQQYLGRFVPDTIPFPGIDMNDQFRYYSRQKRIKINADLNSYLNRDLESMDKMTFRTIIDFIRSVRKLIEHEHIIPDLAGGNNVVVGRPVKGIKKSMPRPKNRDRAIGKADENLLETGREHVYLIDINNVQPVISNDEFHRNLAPDFDIRALYMPYPDPRNNYQIRRSPQMAKIHPDFFDDKMHPIADESLGILKMLEDRFVRKIDKADRERFALTDRKFDRMMEEFAEDGGIYMPLRNPVRTKIMKILTNPNADAG